MFIELDNRRPQLLGDKHFIAENATLIGDVTLHNYASVWYNAVIRGDMDAIEIGAESNIQDGSVLHTDPGIKLVVGERVTVGHKVMLHGCQIGNNSLIGINSVILNRASIGANVIVGANSLVTEGKSFPDGVLITGTPARVIRELTEEELLHLSNAYLAYTSKIAIYAQRKHIELKP